MTTPRTCPDCDGKWINSKDLGIENARNAGGRGSSMSDISSDESVRMVGSYNGGKVHAARSRGRGKTDPGTLCGRGWAIAGIPDLNRLIDCKLCLAALNRDRLTVTIDPGRFL